MIVQHGSDDQGSYVMLCTSFPVPEAFPPILSPSQAAAMVDRSLPAIHHWPAQAKLDGISRRRGKHRYIWRDRLIASLNGQQFQNAADGSINLTPAEIDTAFATAEAQFIFPPYMSVKRVARLLDVGRSTIFRWKALGYLDGCFIQRSDGIRFMRTQLLLSIFNGASWNA